MDKFVKNFIAMSMIYLTVASLLGVMMLPNPELLRFKFVHSHLMLLGWVSMMIYGVGYHILPRFAGKLIKQPAICVAQFWLANIGLVGMLVFYSAAQQSPQVGWFTTATVLFGLMEAASIVMFFYVMGTTLFGGEVVQAPSAK